MSCKCKTVYLAGSIAGHKDIDSANEWRLQAEQVLGEAGYRVLNPLRGKLYGQEYTSEEIVARDLLDIAQSEILLVEMDNLGMAYIGTSMEIRYAFEQHKEIYLWGKASLESHWLRYHQTKRFETLEEALEFLVKQTKEA